MGLDLTDFGLLACAVGAGLGALFLNSSSKPLSPLSTGAPTKTSNTHKTPPGHLPILESEDLFKRINAKPALTHIYQSLGFTPENYKVDVEPLLRDVAEFVQLLPASESHHHANPGGLLSHLLDVASIALRLAEATKLPIGRATEEQLKFAARWRYAVLVAALLHDIGKPVSDTLVEILDQRNAPLPWNGLGGKMADYGHSYRVSFPLEKDYKAHQRLPVMLLKTMVPPSTMKWLSDDRELIPLLISYLSCESEGGIIGDLVKKADGTSVSTDLLSGDRTRFASARQVPLIERLMLALKRMLHEGGHIPLNREGAAGFYDGEDIWFVAGVIADKTREYLNKVEVREQGASAIPTDNSRIFDIWLDYGAAKSNNGSAIWKAVITLDKGDGKKWVQNFTMLRFSADTLFDQETRPEKLNGTIELLPDLAQTEIPAAPDFPVQAPPAPPTPAESPVPAFELTQPTIESLTAASNGTSSPDDEWGPPKLAADPSQECPSFTAPELTQPTTQAQQAQEYLDPADMAGDEFLPPLSVATTSSVPETPTAPVAPAEPTPPRNSVLGNIKGPAPEVDRFIAWIQKGVGDGSMKYNRADAAVHFVAEGLFLISPRIIRDFLKADGVELEKGDSQPVKKFQNVLQKSGYVAKQSKSTFLHFYKVINAKDSARSMVAGYLIENPSRFFNPIPDKNTVLEKSSDGGAG